MILGHRTGSTDVGREIAAEAGRALKKVSLELGGKAPSIITADADIDAAVEGNLMGGLLNSGQVCAAYTRFYVDARRADEFSEKLAAAARSMTIGNGLDAATQLGPLVTPEQVDRVDAFVRIGKDEGAQLLTGGTRGDGELARGNFMRIAREEIFGPVLSVLPYDDPDQLVELANDTDYGLAGGRVDDRGICCTALPRSCVRHRP